LWKRKSRYLFDWNFGTIETGRMMRAERMAPAEKLTPTGRTMLMMSVVMWTKKKTNLMASTNSVTETKWSSELHYWRIEKHYCSTDWSSENSVFVLSPTTTPKMTSW
jgi:hypothetical protein